MAFRPSRAGTALVKKDSEEPPLGRGDTDDGGQGKHEPHHDTSKVARDDGVDDDEDMLITEIAETQEDASREEEIEEIEVHEECWPCCRLVFRD